jgi:predicted ribosomally synthesized peptide with SipW-like signal peptide
MKKKIIAICLAAIIAVTAIASTTLAYLTDKETQVNTFTSGNVDIKLDEKKVVLNEDGYISEVLDERTEEDQDYGKMYPGQVVTKDPTITNVGSEKAYVAAIITVTSDDLVTLEEIIGTGYEGLLGINEILSGGIIKENDTMKTDHPLHGVENLPVYGDDTYSVYQLPFIGRDGDIVEYQFYVFFENPLAHGESVVLFDTMTIDADWDNAEMAAFKNLKIKVDAYAVQVQTFDDCFDAMTTAFYNQFPFAQ